MKVLTAFPAVIYLLSLCVLPSSTNAQRAVISLGSKLKRFVSSDKRKRKSDGGYIVEGELASETSGYYWEKLRVFDPQNQKHRYVGYIVLEIIITIVIIKSLSISSSLLASKVQKQGDDDEIIVEEDIEKTSHDNVDIGFENIKLVLKQKGQERVILDGSIRGRAQPGRMLAIMGPSGSGKSSLIHALAGKIKFNPKLRLEGKRYLNGQLLSGDSMIPSAFIEQEVNFFPHMTVKETLDFRVELKLGKQLSKSQRDDVVSDLMKELGLSKSQNTKVGNSKIRGISGGEKKRLSIAVEMISSPSVIFLDEPTSGLDSYQATQVIQTLRKLANAGKTVIAVIHQPNQHVFSLFDDLLLLSEGKLMYNGARGDVRTYLDSIGYEAPSEMGTAEHVLECISRTNGDNAEQSTIQLNHIAEQCRKNASGQVLPDNFKSTDIDKHHFRKYQDKVHRPSSGLLRQFKLLLDRALHETFRGKATIILKIVQQVSLGIIYGGIYHLSNNQASIQDRAGLLSLIAIGAMNMGLASTVRSFPKEKAIVSSEMSSNLYSAFPYFFAKALSEIPLVGLFNSVFAGLVYKLTGLNRAKNRFVTFLSLITLHSVASEALGLVVGAISPSSDFALALFPPIVILNVIFDGKNVSEENTPRLLRWIAKVGIVRWGFEGLALNEFEGLTFDTSGPRRGPAVKTGSEALERFDLGRNTIPDVFKAQSLIIGISWSLAFLALQFTKQKHMTMQLPSENVKESEELQENKLPLGDVSNKKL